MTIQNDAMVLNLRIKLWLGHKFDQERTRQLTDDASAERDAARVNKHLVPKEALKEIVSVAGAIRNHFYTKTLPWKDNGDRLITRSMYFDFMQAHGKLVQDFEKEVQNFLNTGYVQARERAEFRMGAMFDPNDYPSVQEIERKFGVALDIDAVTEAGDFRVTMDADTTAEIKAQMEQAMQERLSRALRNVWERLDDTLSHFAEKMEGDAIFRNTTVTNLEELIDLLPGLNVCNDPTLTKIGEDIKHRVLGWAPATLRKDTTARAAAATEAKAIMDQMRGFMTAFGHQQ